MALQYNHEVNHSRRLAMKKEMHKTHAALMKRTSLSMRSWQRQLEVCRDLPLILQQTGYSRKQTCFRYPWPVKTLICFWNITCATLLLLLLLDNILQKWLSSFMLNLLLLCGFHASCSSSCLISASKSHGIFAFWSCDRIGKLNETYL